MAQLPSDLITHSQKVCRLYKAALRSVEDWYPRLLECRYQSLLMRQRFEKNRYIADARVAKKLLLEGQKELFETMHWQPYKFPESVGGVAYKREPFIQDYVVDFWDPIEKARYPKYFARREELKKEYMEFYAKLYPETPESSGDKGNA